MEQDTKRLGKIILWEVSLVFVIVLIVRYFRSYTQLEDKLQDLFFEIMPPSLMIIFVLIATKLMLTFLKVPFDSALNRYMGRKRDVQVFWQLFSYMIWIAAILLLTFMLVGNLFSIGILIIVVLIGIFFLFQKPLQNIAGWLGVIFLTPYQLGDFVEVDGNKGYVVEIDMFNTTLQETGKWMESSDFTGRRIVLPNHSVFSSVLYNYSLSNMYIWDRIIIHISLESDIKAAEILLVESAREVVGHLMKKKAPLMMDPKLKLARETPVSSEPHVRVFIVEEAIQLSMSYLTSLDGREDIKSRVTQEFLRRLKEEPNIHLV